MRVVPALLLALVSGVVVSRAQETGSQGRAIEFSSPNGAGTHLFNQFFPGGSARAGAVDDVFQAPQAMVPAGTLNGVAVPRNAMQQPSAVQSKRVKVLTESSWWFLATGDEPPAGTTPEEIFNLPRLDANGRDLEKLSPVERYLANQAAKKEAVDKAKIESQQNDAARSIYGVQGLLDPSINGFNGMNSTFSPGVPAIFVPQNGSGYPNQAYGQNNYNPTPSAADTSQKIRMEEFNKMIGMTEADNPQKSPLSSSLSSGSADSVGADWNPFSSAYQAPSPNKSSLPEITAVVEVPEEKPAKPAASEPTKESVEKQYQPLFAPAFSMPRRRVQ